MKSFFILISLILGSQAFSQGSLPENLEIRRRCEKMQAKIRRTDYLVEKYKNLRQKTQRMLEEAPLNRETAKRNLKVVRESTSKRIEWYQKRSQKMTERLVRSGCPKTELSGLYGPRVKKLFQSANSEGVFVDDHVLIPTFKDRDDLGL